MRPDGVKSRYPARSLFLALNICLPILAGLFIYLRYRPDTFLSSFVCRLTGGTSVPSAQEVTGVLKFLRGYAADILWAYALTFSVSSVLGMKGWRLPAAAGICICMEALMECLQLTRTFSGTFDPLDILFESASTGLAVLIIHLFERGN